MPLGCCREFFADRVHLDDFPSFAGYLCLCSSLLASRRRVNSPPMMQGFPREAPDSFSRLER